MLTSMARLKRRTKTLTVRNASSAEVKDFAGWLTDE